MDRSEISRLTSRAPSSPARGTRVPAFPPLSQISLHTFVILLMLVSAVPIAAPVFAAEERPTPTPTPRKRGPSYSAGVFFGHVLYVDPEGGFLFLKPIDPALRRKHFYVDRKTLYTLSEEGRRTKKKFHDIVEGQKVAVRFFGRDDIVLADEIFVVSGEFLQPQAYNKRQRKSLRKGEGLSPEEFKARMQQKGGHSSAEEREEQGH